MPSNVNHIRPPAEPLPLPTTDLSKLLANGVPEPQFLCDSHLYRGGLHCIAGAPDCGKTTLAFNWAVTLMKLSLPVLIMDEEGGREIVVEKLSALGATVEDLTYLTYIEFPGLMWTPADIARLQKTAEQTKPVLAIWDSSAAFMARAGLDENGAPDVTTFWANVLIPLARKYHAAVLVIDHDTKSTEESRDARGSGAKLATIDVQIKVKMETPFTRHQEGQLTFTITKDRRGYLHRYWDVTVTPVMSPDPPSVPTTVQSSPRVRVTVELAPAHVIPLSSHVLASPVGMHVSHRSHRAPRQRHRSGAPTTSSRRCRQRRRSAP